MLYWEILPWRSGVKSTLPYAPFVYPCIYKYMHRPVYLYTTAFRTTGLCRAHDDNAHPALTVHGCISNTSRFLSKFALIKSSDKTKQNKNNRSPAVACKCPSPISHGHPPMINRRCYVLMTYTSCLNQLIPEGGGDVYVPSQPVDTWGGVIITSVWHFIMKVMMNYLSSQHTAAAIH